MQFNGNQQQVTKAAAQIRMLLLDVDGVLTDGRLYVTANGEEMKVFHTLDGHGIKLLQQAGIPVGIISGRDSPALARRAHELGIKLLYKGREDKLAVVEEILADHADLQLSALAYAGDDLPDLPVIEAVGLGITVPNAHPSVKQVALLQTSAPGGCGAVREICDFLLASRSP
ncbi:MAG: hypothetical protein RLZZ385_441 [Pseudomonadota bacterium]|jgi:3-deoxy-D-manno-octulosonate 8-phosphate phosphatase (KDO 8-P phosphatase)